MSSSRTSSASSWKLSLGGKGRNNNRNGESRPNMRQPRSNNPVPAMKASNRTSNNEIKSNNGSRKIGKPFSSLLSSSDNNKINRPKLDLCNSRVNSGSNQAPSAARSFPKTTAMTNTKSPNQIALNTATSGGVTPSDQAAIASDVGSDLLEFGASVEFHEDHRRHIHAETLEIEASNKATREAVSKESRTEEQLMKDLARSKTELLSLNQGAEDQFESAKMFWTLTTNLRREFESRIVEATKPVEGNADENPSQPTPSEPNHPPSVLHPVTPDVRNKEAPNDESDSSESPSNGRNQPLPLSNEEILAQKASRAEKMLQALNNERKSIEAIQTEINGLKEKQTQLEESTGYQGRQESLERAKEEERRVQSEILQDRETKATRIVQIQQLRESCGTNAQTCADLEKKLIEAKNANAIEEVNLRNQLQTIQTEVESLVKKKEETTLQIEVEQRNIEKYSNEMDNYYYYCKVREDHKRATALRREKKKELLARQAEAMRKLKEARGEEKASELRKQQAQKEMSLAESLRTKNSKMESDIILPGKAELVKLSERKGKLAEQIAEFSKAAEKQQSKEREELAAKSRAKEEAIAQAEKLNAEYKAKVEEKEATSKMHQEFIRSHNEQIASYASQAEKFVQLQTTEREAYERRLTEAKERWSEKLSHHIKEQEQVFEAHAFKAEVMERGILLLQDAEKAEREAQHAK